MGHCHNIQIIICKPYIVKAGALSFSVIVFCSVALVCLSVFYIRRIYFGGELGGPVGCKHFSAALMLSLWFIYILLSALQAEGVIVV